MAIFEYEFLPKGAEKPIVTELHFRVGQAPEAVVIEYDGEQYEATRIMSLTAKMATNWSIGREGGDLPPENSPLI